MTPKRFKAVCTETGREFGAAGLYYSGVEYDKWDNPVGQTWAIDFEDENDDPTETDVSKVELCQSTGLTDSRGQEVYEGDVLVYNYPAHATHPDRWPGGQNFFQISYSEGGFRFSNCMLTSLAKPTFDNDQNHVSQAVLKKSVVIGNAWMSYKELKSMAEAVSNEGVKRE